MNMDMQYNTGVYILTGTLDGEPLIKVGMTSAGLADRIQQLRTSCYAGIKDWKLHSWMALDNERLTSAVERMAHDELVDYRVPLVSRDGTKATEVFDITPEAATHTLNAALNNMSGCIRIDKNFISDGSLTLARLFLQRLIGAVLLFGKFGLFFATVAWADNTYEDAIHSLFADR